MTIETYIWIFFLAGAAINIVLFARLDLARLDFLDGILIGQAYYVIIPLFVFMIEGRAVVPDLGIWFRPFDDLATTGMLVGGLFLFPALRMLAPRVPASRPDTTDPRLLASVVMLFVLTGALSFLMTGLFNGGHWQANVESAFANPLFLPTKYAANVARNAVFAVLLYRVASGRMRAMRAIGWGLCFAGLDVLTTFNRITAVYWLVMVLLLLKHRPWRMILAGGASLATLPAFSIVWPAFRGMATADGYSARGFGDAWSAAVRAQEIGSVDASLNGVFESSNIVVLNWIVENFGDAQRPFLGLAMFARPLTLLVPGAVWPGRPENFGLVLGEGIARLPSLALNSTLYGESYGNFGWFWPLGLSAFVLLWHGVYRLMAPSSRAVQTMGAFAALAMWRFDASFIGCAALLTGALLFALWIARLMRLRSLRHRYRLPVLGAERPQRRSARPMPPRLLPPPPDPMPARRAIELRP